MPKFSVIIPLYNKENHILDTLNSVFNQSFTDYEIILVNDGSTDNSLEVVKKIKNDKLNIFNIENQGASIARNYAMQQAKGDYFAFLDADDIWFPNHLEELNNLIKNYPNCGLYSTNYHFDYGNGFITKPIFPTLPKNDNWSGIITNYFNASMVNRVNTTPSTAIPKSNLNSIGFFDINYTSGQDTDYWTRIAIKKQVAFSKKETVSIKVYANNRLSDRSALKRKFMNLDKFLSDEKTNHSLKKFNDMYRNELALKHRIEGDYESCQFYLKNINPKNINLTNKILLKLPASILKLLWKTKKGLRSRGFDFYIR